MVLLDVTQECAWEVSTAKSGTGVQNLIDGRPDTFWQSSSPVPHFITAHLPRRVRVARVGVYVDYKLDDTYTPRVVIVRIGDFPGSLTSVGEFELREPAGWVAMDLSSAALRRALLAPKEQALARLALAEGFGVCGSIVQLCILANKENGQDSHIRQIKILALPDVGMPMATHALLGAC